MFNLFPLFKFQIKGNSMVPAFKEGDAVLINRLSYLLSKPRIGDIVVLKKERYIIKRIAKINPSADGDKFFVVGDNKKESTDSRSFGWISKREIAGKVIIKI